MRRPSGRFRPGLATTGIALALFCPKSTTADESIFRIREIPVSHRVVQADLVDLDGDARGDLLWTSVQGVPPHERRELRVHFQREDGSLATRPDWQSPMPKGAAAYDLGTLDERPGQELLLLRRDELTLLSLAGREADFKSIPLPASPTLAVTSDERGMDRLRVIRPDTNGEALLLVPSFGETTVLGTDGNVRGRPWVGGRANYFIPERPGPVVSENEVEVYYDHPRLELGDVNGDGRRDLLASNRHELRVFLQREDGSFPRDADQTLALGRLNAEDHIRNVGSVRIQSDDVDGDGRVDLLILNSTGSLFDSESEVSVHLNRDGSWNFEQPDQQIDLGDGFTIMSLGDLDGDGQTEFTSAEVPGGVLEIVKVLLTSNIDTRLAIRRRGEQEPFDPSPWQTLDFDIGFSFDTFRSQGFVPRISPDLNGDQHMDFVSSGDGEEIEIHLGSRKGGFGKRHARQDLDTVGRIRFGELQGDGLSDFVIYDPRRPGSPIRVAWNLGKLPSSIDADDAKRKDAERKRRRFPGAQRRKRLPASR